VLRRPVETTALSGQSSRADVCPLLGQQRTLPTGDIPLPVIMRIWNFDNRPARSGLCEFEFNEHSLLAKIAFD
jgi:hypothetical protein